MAAGIDNVLTIERDSTRWFYLHDGLGSVTELLDENGALDQAYEYDAWGNATIYDPGHASKNPYLYTNRRWDAECGLYYYRARHYAPTLGRFLQPDPASYVDGPNLYVYVGNQPMAFVDPEGKSVACRVTCKGQKIGKLKAYPLWYHTGGKNPTKDATSESDGVISAIHFVGNKYAEPDEEPCCCDRISIIQVITTNSPAPGRTGPSYVDNAGKSTPFYDEVGPARRGKHSTIPPTENAVEWPNWGTKDTTLSIYDAPCRNDAACSSGGGGVSWMIGGGPKVTWKAEVCVVCVRNWRVSPTSGVDYVLGQCVTYGFTRTWVTRNVYHVPFGYQQEDGFWVSYSSWDIKAWGPSCASGPSANFQSTLSNDPTTNAYQWTTAPAPPTMDRKRNGGHVRLLLEVAVDALGG